MSKHRYGQAPTGIKVETVNLVTANGRRIRKVTRVRFPDGRMITFTERLSKRAAITNALRQINKK